MLPGRITKESGIWWSAAVPLLGVFTQGRSRRDAASMLREAITLAIDHRDFKVSVRQRWIDAEEGITYMQVTSNRPDLLIARAVTYAREVRGLGRVEVNDLRRQLRAAAKPSDIKPIVRRIDTEPVQRCEIAPIPRGAMRAYISGLCRRAKIPVRSTYHRSIYVYRGTKEIRTPAFDIVGVPVSPRSRMGALRALESLAYNFREHHARHCVIGRGYFTTKRRR